MHDYYDSTVKKTDALHIIIWSASVYLPELSMIFCANLKNISVFVNVEKFGYFESLYI